MHGVYSLIKDPLSQSGYGVAVSFGWNLHIGIKRVVLIQRIRLGTAVERIEIAVAGKNGIMARRFSVITGIRNKITVLDLGDAVAVSA